MGCCSSVVLLQGLQWKSSSFNKYHWLKLKHDKMGKKVRTFFEIFLFELILFNGLISYLATKTLFAYFFRFVYKIRSIMKIAVILMLNQSNFKNDPSFSEFSEQSWNNNFAMVDPVGSTGCDTAANVHQQLAQHCTTVGLAIIQLLRLVSSILPKSEKSVRVRQFLKK